MKLPFRKVLISILLLSAIFSQAFADEIDDVRANLFRMRDLFKENAKEGTLNRELFSEYMTSFYDLMRLIGPGSNFNLKKIEPLYSKALKEKMLSRKLFSSYMGVIYWQEKRVFRGSFDIDFNVAAAVYEKACKEGMLSRELFSNYIKFIHVSLNRQMADLALTTNIPRGGLYQDGSLKLDIAQDIYERAREEGMLSQELFVEYMNIISEDLSRFNEELRSRAIDLGRDIFAQGISMQMLNQDMFVDHMAILECSANFEEIDDLYRMAYKEGMLSDRLLLNYMKILRDRAKQEYDKEDTVSPNILGLAHDVYNRGFEGGMLSQDLFRYYMEILLLCRHSSSRYEYDLSAETKNLFDYAVKRNMANRFLFESFIKVMEEDKDFEKMQLAIEAALNANCLTLEMLCSYMRFATVDQVRNVYLRAGDLVRQYPLEIYDCDDKAAKKEIIKFVHKNTEYSKGAFDMFSKYIVDAARMGSFDEARWVFDEALRMEEDYYGDYFKQMVFDYIDAAVQVGNLKEVQRAFGVLRNSEELTQDIISRYVAAVIQMVENALPNKDIQLAYEEIQNLLGIALREGIFVERGVLVEFIKSLYVTYYAKDSQEKLDKVLDYLRRRFGDDLIDEITLDVLDSSLIPFSAYYARNDNFDDVGLAEFRFSYTPGSGTLSAMERSGYMTDASVRRITDMILNLKPMTTNF